DGKSHISLLHELISAKKDYSPVLSLFLKQKIDISATEPVSKTTALHLAVKQGKMNYVTILMNNKKCNINAEGAIKDGSTRTPLSCACNNVVIVNLLLTHKDIDIN